jgi:hypothetical protein
VFSVEDIESGITVEEIIAVDIPEEVNGLEILLHDIDGDEAVFKIDCEGPDVVDCGVGHDLMEGAAVEYNGRYVSVFAIGSSSAVFSVEDIESGSIDMEIIALDEMEQIDGIEIVLEDIDDGVAYFVINCDGPSNVGCDDMIDLRLDEVVIYEGRYVSVEDVDGDGAVISVEDIMSFEETYVAEHDSMYINGLNINMDDVTHDGEFIANFGIDCDDGTPYECYSDGQCGSLQECEDGYCEITARVAPLSLNRFFRTADDPSGLAWYWWVLIVLAVLVIAGGLLSKFGCCKAKPKKRKRRKK